MPAYYVRFPIIGKERVEHYNDKRLIATPSLVSLRLKFIECNQLSCVAAFMCFLSQKLFTDWSIVVGDYSRKAFVASPFICRIY